MSGEGSFPLTYLPTFQRSALNKNTCGLTNIFVFQLLYTIQHDFPVTKLQLELLNVCLKKRHMQYSTVQKVYGGTLTDIK